MKKSILTIVAALFVMTAVAQQDYQQAPSNLMSYRSNVGKLYTFKVTGKVNGRVWGGWNNIYTDHSDLATAAVHSGYVKIGETKLIKVRIINDVKNYPSSSRNGINSMKCDTWPGAFHIQSSMSVPKQENNNKRFNEKNVSKERARPDVGFFGSAPRSRSDGFRNRNERRDNESRYDRNDRKETRSDNNKNRTNVQMTNKERADILYRLLRNNMVQMPEGTMYHAGNKTTVRAAIINRRPVTNREYAAATDVWLNRNAPDAPAKVNDSQRNLFIKCMDQAFSRTNLFRVATNDEVSYGDRNGHLKGSGSSYIYFVYRDNWDKYIKNKQYLTIFGEKM